MRVWPGRPYPLGATWDGAGVNFSLFAENATKVELCLFDEPGDAKESATFPLREQTAQVWHNYFPDIIPASSTATACTGRSSRKQGHRFNPKKLLLDPYAKAIGRDLKWDDSLFGYQLNHPEADLTLDERDSAAFAPLAAVVDTAFTWGDDRPPRTPWHKTFIYELHVKGFTKLMPDVPEKLRGTYAGTGLRSRDPAPAGPGRHGRRAAAGALSRRRPLPDREGPRQLLGLQHARLLRPRPALRDRLQPGGELVQEFKTMVRSLHAAGIEVILDVVYNHTAEGNQLGPTLSFRGIDNASYYRLAPDPRYYMDFTGCGNTLNMQHPQVLQLIMDSLRYWVVEMHVDGFRFDLASTLARELYEVDRLGAFFDIIHQDPILSQVKLIAEPWDVGPGGYQVGNFPVLWTEWNGKYRDNVRRFWKGDGGTVSEFATRLAGSQRPLPADRPRPVRQHQLHHLPRRLHAPRPGLLQRQAQRGQRRGEPRRLEQQQ